MLYLSTVSHPTLELIKQLMSEELLNDFILVGGTSLALQIGHRKSVDIDLFAEKSFDTQILKRDLQEKYSFVPEFEAQDTIKGTISNVQIDCLTHYYPWIRKFKIEEGIRFASIEDIIAMKLNAISSNGTRIKDFVDIAYLSDRFSLNMMLSFYEEKYHSSTLMPLKGLTFFDEINFEEPLLVLDGNYSWEKVAVRLLQMQDNPNNVFSKL
ncbi:MAG: nucleotidyl transferase AbiEii/AbiGii toxin family protein [Bacteroidales bacterium]|nr:nucleotidyl transferase AbiEii/AbiGii toxin family protein [Bacteroidales bacterium]